MQKSIELVKRIRDSGDTVGVMLDKQGKLQVIEMVFKRCTDSYKFRSTDELGRDTNFLELFADDKRENRIFLAEILTIDNQFGKGLGSNANTFAEFLLKDKRYEYVYGIYFPGYKSNFSNRQKDYENIVGNFYAKNGYQIVTIAQYLEHPEKFPFLCAQDFEDNDFLLRLVAKDLHTSKQKDFGFLEINGVYVKDNVPEKVMDEIFDMSM